MKRDWNADELAEHFRRALEPRAGPPAAGTAAAGVLVVNGLQL